jgi:hypothetical protein
MNIEAAEGITLIVRAHQLGCRPEDLGSVAGALKICPNGPSHRAKLKVAFVEVRTNIMNVMSSAGNPVVDTGELKNCTGIVELFHGLHQALIVPDLINKETPTGSPYVLDLTDVPAFRHLSTKPSGDARPDWGKLIETNPNPQPAQLPQGTKPIPNEQLAWDHVDFKKALKEEFKRQNPGPQAGGRILIFAWGTEVFVKFDSRSGLGGVCMREPGSQVDFGGYKIWSLNTLANVCLFKGGNTGWALAHEIMHALSLQHTHRERWTPPNIPSNRTGVNGFRYIFPFETTTNIMSYNHAVSHSTWHWQWEAMQDFLRKCNHGGQ